MHPVTLAILGGALLLGAAPSHAHVTLEVREAPPESTYKAVLRVPHGCEGSPTTAIRVRIPEGMIAVKPMPKPGWDLHIETGPYEQAYDDHGEQVAEGPREIAWTGGELLDEHYDEFVLRGRLTELEPGTVLHFPVVQECAEGVHRWIEVPAPGENPDDYDEPAPQLTITAPD